MSILHCSVKESTRERLDEIREAENRTIGKMIDHLVESYTPAAKDDQAAGLREAMSDKKD